MHIMFTVHKNPSVAFDILSGFTSGAEDFNRANSEHTANLYDENQDENRINKTTLPGCSSSRCLTSHPCVNTEYIIISDTNLIMSVAYYNNNNNLSKTVRANSRDAVLLFANA